MAICIADTIFKKLSNFDIHVDVFVSKYIMYFFTVRIRHRGNLFCRLCYCWSEIHTHTAISYCYEEYLSHLLRKNGVIDKQSFLFYIPVDIVLVTNKKSSRLTRNSRRPVAIMTVNWFTYKCQPCFSIEWHLCFLLAFI